MANPKNHVNAPLLVSNAANRSADVPLSGTRKFCTTTAALPGYNTTLALTGSSLVESLETSTSSQQFFVQDVAPQGLCCFTPIIGNATALADSTDANRLWVQVRCFGFKLPASGSPSELLIPTKAELLWDVAFRTGLVLVPDGHVAIPSARPVHATVAYFSDLTFKVNTSTENVTDATRGASLKTRGSIANGAMSIEFDVADFDLLLYTGSALVPSGEDGAAADSWSGVVSAI